MRSIIIVEDDAIVRTYLRSLIDWEANGFSILAELENGMEAKSFIEKNDVDIVITDISMPLMNGIDLIKNINETKKSVKIVVLSCYSDYDFIREALKCGVCDYILKQNLTAEALLELLKKIDKMIGDEAESSRDRKNDGNTEKGIALNNEDIQHKHMLTLEDEKNLLNAVMESDKKQAEKLLSLYIEGLGKVVDKYGLSKIYILDLFNYMLKIAVKFEIDTTALFDSNKIPYEKIESMNNISELKVWLKNLFNKLIDLTTEGSLVHRRDILKAMEYIDSHYTEDISLKDVSNYVMVSSNYFSMLFKKETGESFSDYLIRKKLEKSKQLLKKIDMKVYEAAEEAGFKNNQYFNRVFKEYYDMTPLEYKKSVKQSNFSKE